MESTSNTRRTFVRNAAESVVAVATLSAIPSLAAATPAPSSVRSPVTWDLTWIDRLTGKYRAVFDSNDLSEGAALINAFVFMQSFHDVYSATDPELNAVIVMRGRGVHMAFNGTIWDKYRLSTELSVAGNGNPYAGQLAALRRKGATLLACSLATAFYATEIGRRTGIDAALVEADLRANLIPGVMLMPSGVFSVVRAQQAGCSLIKSS